MDLEPARAYGLAAMLMTVFCPSYTAAPDLRNLAAHWHLSAGLPPMAGNEVVLDCSTGIQRQSEHPERSVLSPRGQRLASAPRQEHWL